MLLSTVRLKSKWKKIITNNKVLVWPQAMWPSTVKICKNSFNLIIKLFVGLIIMLVWPQAMWLSTVVSCQDLPKFFWGGNLRRRLLKVTIMLTRIWHKKKIERLRRLKIGLKIFAKSSAFVPAGNRVFVFTRSIICCRFQLICYLASKLNGPPGPQYSHIKVATSITRGYLLDKPTSSYTVTTYNLYLQSSNLKTGYRPPSWLETPAEKFNRDRNEFGAAFASSFFSGFRGNEKFYSGRKIKSGPRQKPGKKWNKHFSLCRNKFGGDLDSCWWIID